MKCIWNDWNDENNHSQSLQHQGAQQGLSSAGIRHSPCHGHRTQLGDAASARARDRIPNPNNSLGCSDIRIHGFSHHLNLQVTPHTVRAQNEVAGISHVLFCMAESAHRQGRFMHCIPAWSAEIAE